MIHRERLKIPEYVYPADEWRFIENRFYPKNLAQTETFFATSNGYIGMRGSFEEGAPVHDPGTFVNGFYESWPIVYGERAFGFARTGQTIVDVTDSRIIKLYVDDEPFHVDLVNLISFERVLDMQRGSLERDIVWETPSGKRVRVRSTRIVSFEHRHLAGISYEVTLLDSEAPVVISSEARYEPNPNPGGRDPRGARRFTSRPLLPLSRRQSDLRVVLCHETRRSKLKLACGVEHQIETDCPHTVTTDSGDDHGAVVISADAQPGVPIRLYKWMTYHPARRASVEEISDRAERTLDRARRHGFAQLLDGQRAHLDNFWRRSDVEFEGDPAYRAEYGRNTAQIQQALRFNLFHICQATARAEGVGVPAKGLTGDGYEGHYFWDTEIYVLPFLTYTSPHIARNLLKFRYSFLDQARRRARAVNQKGALFPWRTINGEESSAYYAAGTAQYHLNADIVHALRKYVLATGDRELLMREGAEILVETARMWADLGFFSKREGDLFCITGVTGPDEYNTVVNNNCFTNLMARENLWFAAETLEQLRKESPARFEALVGETGLDEQEITQWKAAADRMYLPYDEKEGIHLQDDEFLDKKPWDFENTPEENYPLLLHYHPLVIYRHKVIKQADVVLAMFLLGDEFSDEQKKRNFDYYDPLTTGDSSLSSCIQSIMAAEIGYLDKAVDYARYAALMDLADVAGNVKDGLHIASMGGTWMSIVFGFAGFRDYDGVFRFRPRLPKQFRRVSFSLTLHGQLLHVDVNHESVTYTLKDGSGLEIHHLDEEVQLTPDVPTRLPTDGS